MSMTDPFTPPPSEAELAVVDAEIVDEEELPAAAVIPISSSPAPQPQVQVPAEPVVPTLAPIPDFEGHAVTQTKLKVSGAASVELYDETVGLDDRLRMVGEYRVVGVAFRVDPKTGETVREQILKPLDLTLCPWDPSDPADNGIVRAKA